MNTTFNKNLEYRGVLVFWSMKLYLKCLKCCWNTVTLHGQKSYIKKSVYHKKISIPYYLAEPLPLQTHMEKGICFKSPNDVVYSEL